MNFDAFSHGQIISKLWLCEELERYVQPNLSVWVLGSWYNITAFMLQVRKPDYYKHITGFDTDTNAIAVADKICSAWNIYAPTTVTNIVTDANSLDWTNCPDIVINCSAEHFDHNTWFGLIPKNTIVCIQSTNITDTNEPWLIKQPTPTIKEFKKIYPLAQEFMVGIKPIPLNKHGKFYERYMIIGKK